MVIQKGLAALAMLAAFTIAAEGICSGQWTSVGSTGLYYTIKGTVIQWFLLGLSVDIQKYVTFGKSAGTQSLINC